MQLTIVTLSKKILVDARRTVQEDQMAFRTDTFAGKWIYSMTEKSGFEIYRIYKDDFPVEVGHIKPGKFGFRQSYWWENRIPLIVWFEPSLVISEAAVRQETNE